MRKIVIFIIALLSAGVAVADTGKFLVPVQKQKMNENKSLSAFTEAETVCVLDDCYYVVDEETAQKYVEMGVADSYSPVVRRYLFDSTKPNDPLYDSDKWELKNTTLGWERAWPKLYELEVKPNSPIAVVTDTGFMNHVDLTQGTNNVAGVYQVSTDIASGTQKGRDYYGHGAHVAGIIGAETDNQVGIASVSGGKARVMSIKVSRTQTIGWTVERDSYDGEPIYNTDLISAIDLILTRKQAGDNIVAVNMSLGGDDADYAEYNAISKLRDAGILVIAATGNEGRNLANTKSYPASYDLENIVAVGALTESLGLATYSNYGGATNIYAPGGGAGRNDTRIWSFKVDLYSDISNEYYQLSGTSMATPFITGMLTAGVALYDKDNDTVSYPAIQPAQLVNILYSSSDTGRYGYTSGNQVNVANFYDMIEQCREAAKTTQQPCTSIAPTTYPSRTSVVTPSENTGGGGGGGGGGCSITGTTGGTWEMLAFLIIPAALFARRRLIKSN